MWNEKRKHQAWCGLVFIVGFLLASLAYSGATWRSLGPSSAAAAQMTLEVPASGQSHSAQPTRHLRVRSRGRRSASRRSYYSRAASRAPRASETPQPENLPATPPSADWNEPTDVVSSGPATPLTVTILAGNVDGTAAHIASDISTVLDSNDLRVMTVLGKGSVQNLRDITVSPYLDLAIVEADALTQAQHAGFGDVAKNLTYIAPLYEDEVQILARGNITTIRQLDGKKVGVDLAGSATSDRASLVFGRLGIKPELINLDQPNALMLLQRGMLDAVVFADGKPVPALAALPAQSGLHFVAIPYEDTLQDAYYPTRLKSQDYPNLINTGATVETIAIGTILAAYNAPEGSPRYRKLTTFTQTFFRDFGAFNKPGHQPKWREVNFAADVPGWRRFKPAQDWLDQSDRPPATAAR